MISVLTTDRVRCLRELFSLVHVSQGCWVICLSIAPPRYELPQSFSPINRRAN